jgi:transposase-like protein
VLILSLSNHNGYTTKGARKYKCLECGKYFNDLTGAIFENHRFFIEEMFYIIKEMDKVCSPNIRGVRQRLREVLNFIMSFIDWLLSIARRLLWRE